MKHSRFRASLMRATGAAMLTAAALAGGMQGNAQAAPAAPGDRTVEVELINGADDTTLDLIEGGKTKVTQGEWVTRPPSIIEDGETVVFTTTSTAEEGGTAGRVAYEADGEVRISWKNPWMGPNKITCMVPPELTCRATIDQQEYASATIRIGKK